jgi:rifampicin phosphotransferase
MIGNVNIRLGSGKAGKLNAGNKGALLDQAARAGLAVPAGVLLLDTAWDQAVLRGLMTIADDGRITFPYPNRLLQFLHLPDFDGPVAVRSAFSAEDTHEASLAGYFETVLNVPLDDPDAFADALKTVLESTRARDGDYRRDVLVMRMVQAQQAGVAFTEREHEDDLVNYVSGTAQGLVAGETSGESLTLAKLRPFESRLDDLPAWQHRLQRLLKGVRRWLGQQDWDIEWADDGERCYLVQLRPITRPTRRDEAFTIANHKEILPDLPSRYMTSVIESCADRLFDYYRAFDPSLPSTRPFIEVFYGRPYINLSLMSDMMRIFGLPTRLVTDNIGGETDRTYGLNLQRMIRKIFGWNLPRFAFAQLNSVNHVRQTTETMLQRTANPGTSFTEATETLRWLYTALVTEMFSLTAAMGPMLSLLRGFGTLTEHSARHTTISTQIYHDWDPLRQIVARHMDFIAQLNQGQIPDEAEFQVAWSAYMQQYGHRGVYESDIARPRYHENPAPLLHSLTAPAGKQHTPPDRSLRGWLTSPFWWQARRTIRAREQWRHDAMRGFDRVRQRLLELADNAVESGQLPRREALWMLAVDEVKALDTGWMPDADFWRERQAEIDRLADYDLPDLLHRSDDLEAYNPSAAPDSVRLSGISLTTGRVEGQAWVLREPHTNLPDSFDPARTILVARSVDAGWIATFSRVAGVVVETGGDLSHGSIILREIGLPAVTNVSGVTRTIQTGDFITLEASNGIVERHPAVDQPQPLAQSPDG